MAHRDSDGLQGQNDHHSCFRNCVALPERSTPPMDPMGWHCHFDQEKFRSNLDRPES
jgi:hypothetical protein